MRYTAIINAEGMTLRDLEYAVETALDHIKKGNITGGDSNDTGRFNYDVEEDESSDYLTREEALEKLLDKWEGEEDPDDPLDRDATREIWEVKPDEEIIREWDCEFDRELIIIE